MPPPAPNPVPCPEPSRPGALRLLTLLSLGALLGFGLLALHARTVTADEAAPRLGRFVARADTDTLVQDALKPPPLLPPDSTAADTLAADSTAADSAAVVPGDSLAPGRPPAGADSLDGALLEDTLPEAVVEAEAFADTFRLAPLYFPTPRREGYTAPLVDRPERPFQFPFGAYWRREALLDSTGLRYVVTEEVAQQDARVPAEVDLPAFREAQREAAVAATFRELAARRGRRTGPGGFGITIDIPGGSESAFSTIFGKNEVDLRVNGQANIDLGFDYQTNELTEAATGNAGSLNPDFGQELSLGITGTIGDKLRVNVNYDTQNQFEFENQVSLVYEGYEDDIIQRIEAGNVFLQTPSELIRGGQRLFGLRTDLRFGGLGLTAVASQQDAESEALNIEGGTQTTTFSLAPYDYENNTHFYLAYAFHNWWDEGHRDPNRRTVLPGFDRIQGLEVWLHDNSVVNPGPGNTQTQVTSEVAALVDLGEPADVLQGGDAYLALHGAVAPLPNPAIDQYTDADLALLRDSLSAVDLGAEFGLADADYAAARFRKLVEGVDYSFDPYFGYLSLNRALTENERVAVAYQYLDGTGAVVAVGDYAQGSTSGNQNGDRIVLKLLRGDTPTPNDASWALTMRNVYRVGGRGLTADAFDASVLYEPPGGTAQRTLPGVQIGQQQTLLRTLGLDRLNRDGVLQPDDVFDFKPDITIDPGDGRVIFPNREPFGDYLRRVLEGRPVFENTAPVEVNFQGISQPEALSDFVFDTLYALKPETAELQFPSLNNYAITGTYSSSVQSVYELGFAVVEGSVRVTSGSIELVENVDYTVNYASGTVEITNPAYLTPGQNLRVDYERNQFAAIGSKTLLGLRADYALGDRLQVGATWMRLAERPLVDKYRIGEEPLSNTIFGFDGFYQAEPRWMTRVLDALPLINTRAPSRFEFKGEFAQLLPDHPQTFAFEQERDALRELGRDFKEDELEGISFVDDFEGTENVFSLLQPGSWRLAAAPPGAGPDTAQVWNGSLPVTTPSILTNWRGLFTWYTVQQSLYNGDLCEEVDCTTPAVRQILTQDIFPEREPRSNQVETLVPLDVYIDPTRRGPYNYNGELQTTFAQNPEDVWGAMVQRLPEGYTDFSGRNNIEFVEFIVQPLGGREGRENVGANAVLYVDLGRISEDVLPNGRFNSEDGLTASEEGAGAFDPWGRTPDGQAFGTVDLDEDSGRTEDLGLDGLPSTAANPIGEPYPVGERDYFAEFVEGLASGSPERFVAEEDPSADDYHHFEETGYFNDGNRFEGGRATLQERFSRFFPAHEFNAFESQQQITQSGHPGNSRYPDTEDLDGSGGLDQAESFWRYAVPLGPAALEASPFFQNRILTQSGQTWYLVRIPVRSEEREAVGGIQDFSLIESIRLWTTGHDKAATLRFASLELVGSQWLKSERVGLQEDGGATQRTSARLFIETINNEENSDYAIPYGTLVSRTRDLSGALVRNREQALVFRVEDFEEDGRRAIYKPFTTNRLDLTKYAHLRMFVHGEGFERRDSVRVFLRLGANETEDYYEIEQPLYPYEPPEGQTPNPDSLWQTNVPVPGLGEIDLNSFNVLLSELNQLKVERDDDPSVDVDERYTSARTPEGAPPGARLTIRGTPSIQSVSTVVLGVYNASGGTTAPLENVEVWFNELRVSGYDEESGWSAYARTTLQLADVATVNARFSRQTDGFGELSSGLGERDFQNAQDYSVIATINAHKLLPERYGWNAPVSVSVTQSESTPRFAPQRGDLRIDDLAAEVEEDPDLTPEEREARIADIREASQTASYTRSIRVPLSKSGSRSPWLRYTLDGLSLVYTNTESNARTPSLRFNDADRWTASASYRLTVPRPVTVRPFWVIDDVPVLGLLGALRLNVLPQSFAITADADRAITESQDRPSAAVAADSTLATVPDRFLFPVRRDQTFGHGRVIDFSYSPFTFLSLVYRSDVSQSLSAAGANERFDVYVRDSLGNVEIYEGFSRDEAFAPGGPARVDFGIPDSLELFEVLPDYTVYEVRDLNVLPVGAALSNLFSGERDLLTDAYSQSFTTTFQPRFDRVRWLTWFRPQPVSYGSQFTWSYTPLTDVGDSTTVAGVSTSATIRGGLQLRPRELWRLFPFYRAIEEAEQRGQAAAPGRGGAPGRPGATPADSTEGEGARRSPLPSLASLGRKLFLALTGTEDFTVTYNGTRSASAGGLEGDGYSLLGGLTGDGPSLGYRLALDRRIPLDQRIAFEGLQFQDNLGDNHRLNARTTIRLTPEFLVNLTWDTNWDRGSVFTYAPENGVLVERPSTQDGGGESTVFAFGGSYDKVFEAFRTQFEEDVLADPVADSTGQYVVSDVVATTGVADIFRSSLVRGLGSFGENGFFALPLPNWDVTYSGLGRWPLFRALAQQVTLRHGYYATYNLQYFSNAAAGAPTTPRSFTVGGSRVDVVAETPFLEPNTATVNERFQPLVGVDVAWKGGLQTNVAWNTSATHSLAAATSSVTRNTTDELSLRLSLSTNGLRLPFMRRRTLNNALRLTLTLARTDRKNYAPRYLLTDLTNTLAGLAVPEDQITGDTRLTVEPRISYTLSNQVSVDAFVRYESVESRGSQVPSTSVLNGGFAFRVSFSN